MRQILIFIQIFISIILIVSILLQSRGSGLGSAWGGGGQSYQSRRGVEKFLFISTVFLVIIFFAIQIGILITK